MILYNINKVINQQNRHNRQKHKQRFLDTYFICFIQFHADKFRDVYEYKSSEIGN